MPLEITSRWHRDAAGWRHRDRSFTPRLFPVDKGSTGNPQHNRNNRGANLEQESDRENARPKKVLPSHFHIIATNMTTTMADNTTAGIVSGFVHSTLRTHPCLSFRISCICLRAMAS